MIDFLILALGAFWLTHMHVSLIQRYKIKLPVKQWEFCYHCVGFWYALILYLLPFAVLNIILAACTVAFIFRSIGMRFKA